MFSDRDKHSKPPTLKSLKSVGQELEYYARSWFHVSSAHLVYDDFVLVQGWGYEGNSASIQSITPHATTAYP